MFRTISLTLVLGLLSVGCTNNPNDTRQQAEKATEQLKRDSRQAAGELKKGTEQARTQLTAAAEGVKQGMNDKNSSLVDLNSATKPQLMGLSGVDEPSANAIIADRPYRRPHDVVRKGAISEEQYAKISSNLSAGPTSK
jgi:DNA uptake protein ComE-like DNA-binding protein